jgi:hypothetical protein
MAIRIPIRPLVRGHCTKKMHDPEHLDLEETTCVEEVTNHDYSDCPDWANPRDWYIRGKYELEWNDPETACFIEK